MLTNHTTVTSIYVTVRILMSVPCVRNKKLLSNTARGEKGEKGEGGGQGAGSIVFILVWCGLFYL